jgi:hypothetical protein
MKMPAHLLIRQNLTVVMTIIARSANSQAKAISKAPSVKNIIDQKKLNAS